MDTKAIQQLAEQTAAKHEIPLSANWAYAHQVLAYGVEMFEAGAAAASPQLKWVKASERLPDEPEGKHYRFIETKWPIAYYKVSIEETFYKWFRFYIDAYKIETININQVEWLEEAPAPQKDEILRFAEFFWANIGHTCTNGFYYNQRGEQVTVQQMYESFCQNFSSQAPAPQAIPETKEGLFSRCTLSDSELLAKVEWWVHTLCESRGKAWTLRVPVDFNYDPDMLIIELANRFRAALASGASLRGKEEGEASDNNSNQSK
jgi:hypothetical protein